jgi:hypothetical protein
MNMKTRFLIFTLAFGAMFGSCHGLLAWNSSGKHVHWWVFVCLAVAFLFLFLIAEFFPERIRQARPPESK